MTVILLAVAAGIGGFIRFAIEYRWPPIGSSAFPRATLAVNVVGSLILGVMVHAPQDVRLIIGTGLCGALTTFSGVSLQLHRRIVAGAWNSTALYFGVLISSGLLAAVVGIELSSQLFL
jgi:CrcB protein